MTPEKSTSVSIIVPAYNEAAGIGDTMVKLLNALASSYLTYEVLVIDDGSEDETATIAMGIDGIRVIRHKVNRGYGAALKTGIRHSKYPLVCITDADGTYPNDRIPDLVKHLIEGEFDMVVGSRTGENVKIPLVRRPAKWVIAQLASLSAGRTIPDINSGLRVFQRDVANRFLKLLPNGFSFTTTITLGMLNNGYLVDYVPIDYYARVGQSKIKPIKDTINFVSLIGRTALYFVPLKIFLPLAGLLMLIAIAWGAISFWVLGKLADISTLVIAMGSIQVAVFGLLAELINRRLPNYYRED